MVTTRAPPFRRRPPSRRTQTCKQPPCRLPRRARRPGEVELGREGGGGRASGRMSSPLTTTNEGGLHDEDGTEA